nr:MAG TPA: hypothetical protein [Caudoviricetes sp.]
MELLESLKLNKRLFPNCLLFFLRLFHNCLKTLIVTF